MAILPTTPAGYYRPAGAAQYLGCSRTQFYRYRALGWVVPDRYLRSATGGKPTPLYSAKALEEAKALIDPNTPTTSREAPAVRRRAS